MEKPYKHCRDCYMLPHNLDLLELQVKKIALTWKIFLMNSSIINQIDRKFFFSSYTTRRFHYCLKIKISKSSSKYLKKIVNKIIKNDALVKLLQLKMYR